MCSKDFLQEIQRKFNEAFESQIPELFDIVFDVDGQKLYADKLRLTLASTTFESMLSDRWTSKNDIISIKDYLFNDFKELLSFIYSGKCNLNDSNIMAMLDMAEFYQIKHLKELCDEHLSRAEIKFANIFNLMEISNKYSMKQMKKSIQDFINQQFTGFVKSYEFLNANKTIIEEFVSYDLISPDKIFQAVYEWAEVQAVKIQKESNDETFYMNDAIKTHLAEVFPYILFKKMELRFFNTLAISKAFLFTSDQLNDIFNSYVKFKITNSCGKSIFGSLTYNNTDAIELVKSLQNRESENVPPQIIYWKAKSKIPKTPNLIKKKDRSKWYLIYNSLGYLGVKSSITLAFTNDYLLAEMDSETGFFSTPKCKIEIV